MNQEYSSVPGIPITPWRWRHHNWKPVLGDKLLGIGTGKGFGALQWLTRLTNPFGTSQGETSALKPVNNWKKPF